MSHVTFMFVFLEPNSNKHESVYNMLLPSIPNFFIKSSQYLCRCRTSKVDGSSLNIKQSRLMVSRYSQYTKMPKVSQGNTMRCSGNVGLVLVISGCHPLSHCPSPLSLSSSLASCLWASSSVLTLPYILIHLSNFTPACGSRVLWWYSLLVFKGLVWSSFLTPRGVNHGPELVQTDTQSCMTATPKDWF
jgi:hypothetical protein